MKSDTTATDLEGLTQEQLTAVAISEAADVLAHGFITPADVIPVLMSIYRLGHIAAGVGAVTTLSHAQEARSPVAATPDGQTSESERK